MNVYMFCVFNYVYLITITFHPFQINTLQNKINVLIVWPSLEINDLKKWPIRKYLYISLPWLQSMVYEKTYVILVIVLNI